MFVAQRGRKEEIDRLERGLKSGGYQRVPADFPSEQMKELQYKRLPALDERGDGAETLLWREPTPDG
jgi:hypothetical protein